METAITIATAIKDVLGLLKDFGGWGVLLFLVVVVGWWLRPHIERFFWAHIGLIETMKEQSPKQTAAMELMSESVREMAQSRHGEREALKHLSKAVEAVPDCEERRDQVKVHTDNMRESLE